MKKSTLWLVLMLMGCSQAQPEDYEVFGAPVLAASAVAVEAVIADSTRYVGEAVSLVGTVHAVCQMKGCWLTIQSLQGESIRVDVDRTESGNYAFTVPTDISGRRAIAHGILQADHMDAAARHHYESDAGGAWHPSRLSMVASGVMIASK